MECVPVLSRPVGGNKPSMYAGRILKTGMESMSQTGYSLGTESMSKTGSNQAGMSRSEIHLAKESVWNEIAIR